MAALHRAAGEGPRSEADCESDIAQLERRWFAASKKAEAMRINCSILREMMEVACANWRDAEGRLSDMEALRDALGREYSTRCGDALVG